MQVSPLAIGKTKGQLVCRVYPDCSNFDFMSNYIKNYAKNDRLESKFGKYRKENENQKAGLQQIVPIYKLMSMAKEAKTI